MAEYSNVLNKTDLFVEVNGMDYKELIKKVRMVEAGLLEDNAQKCAAVCHDAATAIETLLAELYVTAEKTHGNCDECANADTPAQEYPCYFCRFSIYGKHRATDHWKWRGLQVK